MIRTRVAALLAAAVLGVAGGTATAVLTGDDATEPFADPLGIDVAMVNLECTGEPVLVIANGDAAPALTAAISSLSPAERKQVRYLRTADSCSARWTAEDSTNEPVWVAYLGPGSRQELCLARMTAAHQGDNVTFLRAKSSVRATCLCEVPVRDVAPVLTPRMASDGTTVIWVKALQNMFVTIDEDRVHPADSALTEDDITGVYDERTIARVRDLGAGSGNRTDGVVDDDLWQRVKDTGCALVDY